jgi:antitoxin HicB
MLQYQIRLKKDTNNTLLVTVPSIPGVVTFGEDHESARAHAIEAIESMFIGYMADHRDIPPPDTPGRGEFVLLPALTEAKLGLYQAMLAARVTKSELGRRLGMHRQQVDRLLNLCHSSKIEQIEAALRVLGKTLSVEIHEAA